MSWRVKTPALEDLEDSTVRVKGLEERWPVARHTRCQPVLAILVRKGPQFSPKVAFISFSYFKASWLEQRRFLKLGIRSNDGTVTISTLVLASTWSFVLVAMY